MAFHLVLASASPRRKELLERMGFSVKAIPSAIAEEVLPEEPAEHYVKRMARAKVLSVVNRIRSTQYEGGSSRGGSASGRSAEDGLR